MADHKKLALLLGLEPHDEASPRMSEDNKLEDGSDPKEQALKDLIDCLGIDPAKVDMEGAKIALHAFIEACEEDGHQHAEE
jgi:hypothetical protein